LLLFESVNQKFPSGPWTMSKGAVPTRIGNDRVCVCAMAGEIDSASRPTAARRNEKNPDRRAIADVGKILLD